MRHTYEFHKKYEKKAYGQETVSVLSEHVNWFQPRYSIFSDHRSIEDRIDKLCESVGNICDLLISKGLITPDEFLIALGLNDTMEVRSKPLTEL